MGDVMQYVRVENGSVAEGPRSIPRSWKNISGFYHLADAMKKAHGWYPVTDDIDPVYDPDTERLVLDSYTIRADDVLKTMRVEALSAAEIKAIADAQQKAVDIVDALPDWAAVETLLDTVKSDAAAASTVNELKAALAPLLTFHKKHARVTYWLAKNDSA